jgi:hypothetical protein
MRLFLTIAIISFFVLIIGLPLVFLIFGIQSSPLVTPGKKLDFDDVARVKQFIKENDPRKLRPNDIKNVIVTERDLNLFLDYALSQTPGDNDLFIQADLRQDLAVFRFSYTLPKNPFGSYLNIATLIFPTAAEIKIRQLKIGSLKIPGWLINPTAKLGHNFLKQFDEYRNFIEAYNAIKTIRIFDGSVSLIYQWQPEVIKKLQAQGRDFLLSADEKERLIAYNDQLAVISQKFDGKRVSLTQFLQPLFQFAEQRTMKNRNAGAENRALILTLAAYIVGRNVGKFLGDEKSIPKPQFGRARLTLAGRTDLSKHFLVSAAISVSGGTGLANFAGIFKEMDDSRGGSGFSFADLAADRAGVRFAEIAIASIERAKFVQQQMSNSVMESDFMPGVENLPEGIQELEFKRTYKDLDSATYRIIEDEIERRINMCRIYAVGQ